MTLTLKQTKNIELDYLFIVFLIGCVSGWIYEVILCGCIDGYFQNRGILYGPWLPIYGIGALTIYSLKPLKKHPIHLFILCGLNAGIVEYLIGFISIHVFGLRLWDYSNMFMNIDGIICLGSILCFAILGILFQYGLEPRIQKIVKSLSCDSIHTFCTTIGFIFLVDCVMSAMFRTPITY
ncbi:putative ABC transporter permease [Floccifex sp.]|uniref:putative ABC transporter permease n=1 Tax=Floccifex sp. TaxID=2815810 RepID=UPI003F0FD987